MTRIAAIVPAYNEASAISAVVNDINAVNQSQNLSIDVVVINDCSTDTTSEIISNLNCISLHLPINLGIGGAVQTGFKYALENRYDYAIQIDGDGQHPANEIPKLVETAAANSFNVVIGSRFISKQGFQSSAMRRVGINYFKWLNKILVAEKIYDSTSGFRLLDQKALSLVCDYYPDEYPEPEAIIIYAMHQLKIGEIPVSMNKRQGGVTSICKIASLYYMFKVTLAIIFTFMRIKFKK